MEVEVGCQLRGFGEKGSAILKLIPHVSPGVEENLNCKKRKK